MLGERYDLKLKYNNQEYKLNINFKFLKNLNVLLNTVQSEEDVFTFIKKYIENDDKGKELDIIYCMLDGEIHLLNLIEVKDNLDELFLKKLKDFIRIEMSIEDIFEEEIEENIEDELEEEDKNFIRYWNYNYYMAIHQLGMNYNKFLNSSPREILTLGKIHGDFYKNIIIKRDIEITKAKLNANIENEEVTKVTRLRDLFNYGGKND